MFRIFKTVRTTKKKMYSIQFKVKAEGKAIAEFFVKAPGHNKHQAMELAEKKINLSAVKAYLIKK